MSDDLDIDELLITEEACLRLYLENMGNVPLEDNQELIRAWSGEQNKSGVCMLTCPILSCSDTATVRLDPGETVVIRTPSDCKLEELKQER